MDEEQKNPKKEELIIQQKAYDMILYAYPAIEQFPKSQKFSLAQDMKKCLDNIMRYIIAANKKYMKKTTLQDLDIEVAALKVYIRIAFDLKYLPPKKYEVWSKMVVEVGRMVGGWIKANNDKQTPDPQINENAAEKEEYTCADCGSTIDQRVKEYSEKKYGKRLCRKCQKKA